MGKHLKLFNLTSEYFAYAADISKMILPNISYCKDDHTKVYYNPLVIREDSGSGSGSGSGSNEPSLEGNKILCKYNVPVTNSSIVLYWASSGSGSGSGSGNGSENTPMFSSMEVDGVEQEVTHLYTFDTTGEHTILFTLAEGVTSIGVHAFYGSGSLTSVTIPNSVTSIDDYAFEGCFGLTSITIPDSVTSIGIGAFNACSGLTSITIPNSVTSIGDNAFNGCSRLTSVTINSDSIVSKTYTTRSNIQNIFGVQVTEYIIGNSVTSIGDFAFYRCSELTSIIIPDSVASIGNYAFFNCSGFTSIVVDANNQTYDSRNNCNAIIETSTNKLVVGCKNTIIPDSVTSIGDDAFFGCSGLTSITIPESVMSISVNAFGKCSGLTSIVVDANNQTYDSRNNCNAIIETSTNKLVVGCKNTIIPDSVTSIGEQAFYYCSELTSITIPDSVTSIGDYAFRYCSELTSITIGNSVTSISNSVFSDCPSLTNIVSNAMAAPTIQSDTFIGIKSGGTLSVPTGSTGYDVWMGTGNYYLGKYGWTKVEESDSSSEGGSGSGSGSGSGEEPVLEGNQVLCKYNVTDTSSATTLYYYSSHDSSYGSSNFTSMEVDGVEQEVTNSYTFDTTGEHTVKFTLANNVTSIGRRAFDGCSELTSITIPNMVTSIGQEAFYNCFGLTSVTIPNSVTSIGQDAFYQCTKLPSITIPDSVTSIGGNAFKRCLSFTSITIPNSVTEIDYGVFYNCSGLTSIIIPNSVTSIGEQAFGLCSKLTSITIPNSVTEIGNEAFVYCSGLTSITIGNSVTSIGYEAFEECRSLTSVTIGNSVTSIDDYAFSNCLELNNIICNATTAPTIGSNTFQNLKTNGTLTIPTGSTGYNVWMTILGNGWNKVEA